MPKLLALLVCAVMCGEACGGSPTYGAGGAGGTGDDVAGELPGFFDGTNWYDSTDGDQQFAVTSSDVSFVLQGGGGLGAADGFGGGGGGRVTGIIPAGFHYDWESYNGNSYLHLFQPTGPSQYAVADAGQAGTEEEPGAGGGYQTPSSDFEWSATFVGVNGAVGSSGAGGGITLPDYGVDFGVLIAGAGESLGSVLLAIVVVYFAFLIIRKAMRWSKLIA